MRTKMTPASPEWNVLFNLLTLPGGGQTDRKINGIGGFYYTPCDSSWAGPVLVCEPCFAAIPSNLRVLNWT